MLRTLFLQIVLIGYNINDCCNRMFKLWPLRLCLAEAAFVMAASAFDWPRRPFDWPLRPFDWPRRLFPSALGPAA